MFDFLDSDWFIIGLEIVFLIFISYDLKKYFETKKKEYIVNIVLTIGFGVWTLIPFYNSYMTWDEAKKQELIVECKLREKNETLCGCVNDKIFKEYSLKSYKSLDENSSDFKEFIKETKEECLDDSWF
ncbi:MAG: hypothetical protein WC390_02220 [Sulfurimonas sp.]|jgi:hypothetical protein